MKNELYIFALSYYWLADHASCKTGESDEEKNYNRFNLRVFNYFRLRSRFIS
jgi:hypothetical protein